MKISQIKDALGFEVVNLPEEDRDIGSVFCCDLLSLVMSRAPADCAWVTVMGNVNTAAVALLADVSCIIVAENCAVDADMLEKVRDKEIAVFKTELPVFEAAMAVQKLI